MPKCLPGCSCGRHNPRTITPESRERMRQAQQRLVQDPEFLRRRSEGMTRRWADPTTRAAASETMKSSQAHQDYAATVSGRMRETRLRTRSLFQDSPTRAGYRTAHRSVVLHKGKAKTHTCPCGKPALDWALQHDADPATVYRDPSGGRIYSTTIDAYVALCRSCHLSYDNQAGVS